MRFLLLSLHALEILRVFDPLQVIFCFSVAVLLLGVRSH